MEQVHGVDVSWMSNTAPKDKVTTKTSTTASEQKISPSPRNPSTEVSQTHANGSPTPPARNGVPDKNATSPIPVPRRRSRSGSSDKAGSIGTSPKRSSWFSSISSKFSSSQGSPAGQTPPQSPGQQTAQHERSEPPTQHEAHNPNDQQQSKQQPQSQAHKPPETIPENSEDEPPIPRHTVTKNAVLPHATKPTDNGPYTPAPPKSGQAGVFSLLRRLSSSSAATGGSGRQMGNGLVERRILNVDHNRTRCPISELKDAKLRRVAFCVDVEIAPMPKYADADVASKPKTIAGGTKKKLTEKGEGAALKNPKTVEEEKEAGADFSTPDTKAQDALTSAPAVDEDPKAIDDAVVGSPPDKEKDGSKKKEKKKRSEEERKARKEKKRKLAEANGSIPMEIHYDSESTDEGSAPTPGIDPPAKTSSKPTTNPVRIYRRCCQLRESPILKKITEQLLDTKNYSSSSGIVYKLDLSGYWMQLGDLITLGDFLAVVPVRSIDLDGTQINDEGLRVILAGLLAARRPDSKRRRPKHGFEDQGGVIEAISLKNNKLGPDGWKHISLFVYRCESLKHLEMSNVPFPRQPVLHNGTLPNGTSIPRTISDIFAAALAERPGGALELVNIGGTEPSMEQLGTIVDGLIKCRVKRIGLGNNNLNREGLQHVARYLTALESQGLDLGGNDLRDDMDVIVESLKKADTLWALGMAGCNLDPSALSKILPVCSDLREFRFIDLSRNSELFSSSPSAVGMLRRHLPKMQYLRRIHLKECGLSAEQAIAIVEVLPEVKSLAHIDLLGNEALMALADATTEAAKEEACALYASLMAASRVSKTLVCVDIEVPTEYAGEIVKAMAKQVVAYCLRNMSRIQDNGGVAALSNGTESADENSANYPEVLAPLLGHDVLAADDVTGDGDPAPDEDYVIGGTGVVRALTCCLQNRGDESRRPSGEYIRDAESTDATTPAARLPTGGKAKDMSKHLLAGARKIRQRLQPALQRAMVNPSHDPQDLRKLTYLDDTLKGIIHRFEDEYPDTKEPGVEEDVPLVQVATNLSTSPPRDDVVISDNEEDMEIHASRPLSRSNSMLSRSLAEEEGRTLRVGHQFRSRITRQEEIDMLKSIDDMASDPRHADYLTQLAEEVGGEFLEIAKVKGPIRAMKEHDGLLQESMQRLDPEAWHRFVDSQKTAIANISVPSNDNLKEISQAGGSAISDD